MGRVREEVFVVEFVHEVCRVEGDEFGDDVGVTVLVFFLPGVDGVEAEERAAGVCGDETLLARPVDDVPCCWEGRVEGLDGVEEALGAGVGVGGGDVGVPDADHDVVFGDEEGVQVGWGCGEGCQDGGFAGGCGGAEDAVGRLRAKVQVVVEDVPGLGIGAGV